MHKTTFSVACDNAKNSSNVLSMSKEMRPEQCITTVLKYKPSKQKKHIQFVAHVQFTQFNTTNINLNKVCEMAL